MSQPQNGNGHGNGLYGAHGRALVSGLLTGLRTPFSGRIQIVGKSPLTGTWADSNSGGSTAIHLRHAGYEVDKMITKKLSRGDCPAPCKGIVRVKNRGLSDVRRPDYETIVGFGANILNDDLELVTAGLCMFTGLTGGLPWVDMVNALTGWDVDQKELLLCGERIQNLRNAFNVREGIRPADFQAHPRMKGEGDGLLEAGPLAGVRAPLEQLKRDYYQTMDWDPDTGRLSRGRAERLGMAELLDSQLA